ncbi:MAG TPA: 2-dehydropantoate 2-reductase [Povalibacter sp.]|uniref:ketopantoate reductase family protein n=1 Tax=Povalibacter sp. TaxID=1962978 RepID=UPI002D18CEF1|nr:2-dehydropantoate 2-reductase [Povalibacter sp.]HMN45306.1 2-dehydropantoate 2-reductase [Povalibacter sp.]
MTPPPSILIVGAGAIGALYGSALARQGAAVSVVCRSDFEQVQRHGYAIRSPLLGDHVFRPHAVLREVAQCTTPPDYLILTVKVLPDVDRVALIRPAVGPGTTIVLIENGIDIEDELVAAFPGNELLSTLAFVQVSRTGQGEIVHHALGSLSMGCYPAGITPAAERLAALLGASKIECRLTSNVVAARWQKAVWNTAFNPISVLGGVFDTEMMLRTPENQQLIRLAMNEVCAAAAAAGHPMHPKLVDRMIADTRALPGYKTSMALDYENGRPMEIEAILGNVVRSGRKNNVAMPVLETVYALAQMVQNKQDPNPSR